MLNRVLLFAALVCGSAELAAGEDKLALSSTPEKISFFENNIRPLLIDQCFDCHNEDVQESDLRLDSLQAMLNGGDRGTSIVPGDAKNSLLIHAVNHSEAELQMPEGDKLAAQQIKWLAKWIDDGAIWPGQQAEVRDALVSGGPLFSAADKNFWAFVPPQLPALPKVANRSWPQSELDYFVLAKLESNSLQPAPRASKRSLIRRAYFDLIGLPPSQDEVSAFLKDDSPNAFQRVIDHLLASPQYGVRWGRHWLDVARYADSNGLDENWAFEFIYKYRDWVIDAFNADMPYITFVTHQLAGDLIPQRDHESMEDFMQRVAAAGFLSVGPKMIADDDPKKKKMDIIDEQLGTVSQAFMALTVGCARCHDHKFDPIPTWDYYAMASIFKSTKTMEHLRVVAPVSLHEFKYEGYDEHLAAYDAKLKQLVEQRDTFWIEWAKTAYDQKQQQQNGNGKDATQQKERDFKLPKEKVADKYVPKAKQETWKSLKSAIRDHEKSKPALIKVMAPTEGEVEDLKVSLRGNYLTTGPQTKRQFLRIIDGEASKPISTQQSGRLELANWIAAPQHPLTARVLVNRVWRWRFGRGIVSTPDNFGKLGQRPTHPQLLDWLAVKFIEDGWSIKKLHKRIMLSATYQMDTQFDERGNDVDPQNIMLWRFPRLRLEAEAIRDAILCVSDNLDLTLGGSLMPLKDRTYVTGTASKQQQYGNTRRSVYQPVYRSAVYDVLTAFDFPDPATSTGDRKNSVVAPQALLMLNSDLVADNALRLAKTLLADFKTDEQRLETLYARTVSRPPTQEERNTLLFHLEDARDLYAPSASSSEQDVQLRLWQGVCRAVISSNEFVYLD